MVARLQVHALPPAAAGEVIELFDHIFILPRGRTISFARRFHDLFAGGDCLVMAGRSEGQLATALLVRFFAWIDDEVERRGAMIGLVCTSPGFRGCGYATELLQAAEQQCQARGCELAVLWAARHELYERCGWTVADGGTLGIHVPRSGGMVPDGVLTSDGAATRARIQALHGNRALPRIRRTSADYGRLLPPAESLLFFLERDSFAICGRHGRVGYLYDIAARDGDLPRLWSAVAGSFERLHVNVEDGSAIHRSLAAQTGYTWARQSLAMWKPLASPAGAIHAWHIPFLDRI